MAGLDNSEGVGEEEILPTRDASDSAPPPELSPEQVIAQHADQGKRTGEKVKRVEDVAAAMAQLFQGRNGSSSLRS